MNHLSLTQPMRAILGKLSEARRTRPIAVTFLAACTCATFAQGPITVTDDEVMLDFGTGGPATPLQFIQKKDSLRELRWVTLDATADSAVTLPRTGDAGFFQIVNQSLSSATTPLSVSLSGAHEKPNPVTTDGTGSGLLLLEGSKLTFSIQYSGLSGPATAAHIHGVATAAEAAGVMINLAPYASFGAAGFITGSVELDNEQRDAVLAGDTYVNIHTSAHGSGEIRGQIAPVLMQATLSGAAERPNPVTTDGGGRGRFLLIRNELTFVIDYSGLSGPASAAHIHGPATSEESTGVLENLAPFNGGAFGQHGSLAGTMVLDPGQLEAVIDGLTYVNIHTGANGSGEIRGQIEPLTFHRPFSAVLSGDAERPNPVTTDGSGLAALSLDGDELTFVIRYENLSGTASAAHIHGRATAEESTGVMIGLNSYAVGSFGASGVIAGSVTVTAEQKAALLTGDTYINIHTAAHGSGEIRGQISPVMLTSAMSGAAERPTQVETPALGLGLFALVGNKFFMNASYTGLTGPATNAHVHGPAGLYDPAGVLFGIVPHVNGELGASGSFAGDVELTPAQLRAIIDWRAYVNIHTSAHGSGEIRGQITQ